MIDDIIHLMAKRFCITVLKSTFNLLTNARNQDEIPLDGFITSLGK
ncbi:hypothetical protein LRP50_20635 [Enterovibrio sp. ZSDZ42]|uniref:Transposase n=1 Tax=Enterovibrio gelatinilyticus TaxID=2899819 RepID=A0ABT5R5I3_9GAMM|nr:hypothetical protein [Enterovibrio sp. ZSDZ42]MDD1795538.1 hypothetical protein [Enterovibrio sp. ZSDZ42]